MGTYGIGFLSLFLSLPHILLYCTSRHVSTESFIQCRIAPYSSSRSPPFTAAQQRDRHSTGWQQPTAGAEAASNRQFVHERTLTRHSNHDERRTKKKERKKKRKERETERGEKRRRTPAARLLRCHCMRSPIRFKFSGHDFQSSLYTHRAHTIAKATANR